MTELIDQSTNIEIFQQRAANFIRRNVLRVGAIGIAAVGVGALEAPDLATAKPTKVTPDSIMVSALQYTGNTVDEYGTFTDGVMDYVKTLHLARHTFQVSGPCHPVVTQNANWVNQVSFELENRYGRNEVNCAYGGQRSGKELVPLSNLCNLPQQVNCPDMNFEPELQIIAQKVKSYTGLGKREVGNLDKVVVNMVEAKIPADIEPLPDARDIQGNATFYFGKVTSARRDIKEIILTTNNKGKESTKKVWYSRA